jgi:hypothetical protein
MLKKIQLSLRRPMGKERITIRLDSDVLDWFRAQAEAKGGGSYQTMINDALKGHIRQGGEDLEALLRTVIREELKNRGSRTTLGAIPPGRL